MIFCELMTTGVKPVKEYSDDGGYDLIFPKDYNCDSIAKLALKIKILLPMGWSGFIRPRSSAYLKNIDVNGTIDRYTGEIFVTVQNHTGKSINFKKGTSVAQFIPVFTGAGLTYNDFYYENTAAPKDDVLYNLLMACDQIKIIEKLPMTIRGEKGHGSTGKK